MTTATRAGQEVSLKISNGIHIHKGCHASHLSFYPLQLDHNVTHLIFNCLLCSAQSISAKFRPAYQMLASTSFPKGLSMIAYQRDSSQIS
ncbi:hypothetical protein E2C01_004353 [Portunus trituberculatus]|uniref:Uncharacterized protein n=1 Tax=Portunus trituberculatus TaxID=210409 RepID=A0A5B7CS61_PORTR|nr:hypothetical protein [Portunus trituberculatus]